MNQKFEKSIARMSKKTSRLISSEQKAKIYGGLQGASLVQYINSGAFTSSYHQ